MNDYRNEAANKNFVSIVVLSDGETYDIVGGLPPIRILTISRNAYNLLENGVMRTSQLSSAQILSEIELA